jgi:hypothetical protein
MAFLNTFYTHSEYFTLNPPGSIRSGLIRFCCVHLNHFSDIPILIIKTEHATAELLTF